MRLSQRGKVPPRHLFSECLDRKKPPLFKDFLRSDAPEEELRVRCVAATGCAEQADDPPLEDEVRIPPTR